ncbi:OmpA family protein [Aurantiacibacter sediminis]|uniref:OmpA family protein n=1 Tax=Aurantiacibacter sediminis TaxID=2793064 RepID=A0ABS0N2K9_9SPHN|nr:OmpA family protein [Aurantiacibacter sediminis]MBH5321535.1 OmpA family protein [Aurantiacibacter sediminis]
MRRAFAALSLSALIAAPPALAQDDDPRRGAYVAIDAGAVLPADFDTDIGADKEDARTSTELGWGVDARLGYDAGRIRLELEGSHQFFGAEEITSATRGIPDSATTFATGSQEYDGDFSLTSVMANALVDFGDADEVQFAAGGGIGRSWMDVESAIVGASVDHLDASDNEWAWQLLAEARVPVAERVDLGVRYRYFSTLEFEVEDSAGRATDFELRTHTLTATLTVHLGGRSDPPTEPVSVPPAPEPAPPPPTPPERPRGHPPGFYTPCEQGPFIVFFDWDESEITPEAAAVLDVAITAYSRCNDVRVMLAGHADTSGPSVYNVRLSERRNAAVRDYLTRGGLPAFDIASQAFGESRPRVPTADGVRELQNRRVEITYGPGSGN